MKNLIEKLDAIGEQDFALNEENTKLAQEALEGEFDEGVDGDTLLAELNALFEEVNNGKRRI